MGSLLLPCAAPGVSRLAVWCLSGATPRRQPWTLAVTLPQGCDGLRARRMAGLWTFRELSLCRHVRRALLRNASFDFTPIIPATACHQSNYFETYSRFMAEGVWSGSSARRCLFRPMQFEHLRVEHQVNGFLGCDYNISIGQRIR